MQLMIENTHETDDVNDVAMHSAIADDDDDYAVTGLTWFTR